MKASGTISSASNCGMSAVTVSPNCAWNSAWPRLACGRSTPSYRAVSRSVAMQFSSLRRSQWLFPNVQPHPQSQITSARGCWTWID